MSIKTYLLKVLRPVMVAGNMIEPGRVIELVEHKAIELVNAGKAEFHVLEEKVEKALGIDAGDATLAGAAAGGTPAPPAAPQPAAPAADASGAEAEPPAVADAAAETDASKEAGH